MRVSSIFGFKPGQKQKQTQTQTQTSQDLSSFGVQENQVEKKNDGLISKQTVELLKSKYLPSRKDIGHSEEQNLFGVRLGTSGYSEKVQHYVKRDNNTTISRTGAGFSSAYDGNYVFNVYFAKPYEQITEDIKKKNPYIVSYDEPDLVPKSVIDTASNSSDIPISQLKLRAGILEAKKQYAEQKLQETTADLDKVAPLYESIIKERDMWQGRFDDASDNEQSTTVLLNSAESKYTLLRNRETKDAAVKARVENLKRLNEQSKQVNQQADEERARIEKEASDKVAKIQEQIRKLQGEQ